MLRHGLFGFTASPQTSPSQIWRPIFSDKKKDELWCFATFVVFLFGSSKFLIFSGSWKILTVPCEASFVSVLHTFICDVLSSLVQSKNIPSWKTSGLSWSQKNKITSFRIKQVGWIPQLNPLLHYRKMLPSNWKNVWGISQMMSKLELLHL